MIILKHGKTYREITCPHCGAILGVGDADILDCENHPVDFWCEECGGRISHYDIYDIKHED